MIASDEDKRKLVVKEIESWRRNKLLPEQYSDFLLNLYLDDLEDRPKGFAGRTLRRIGQASGKSWLLSFGSFALICFVVLHFSAFPLLLQIAIGALTAAGFALLGARLREERPTAAYTSIGAGMASLSGIGFAIAQLHGGLAGAGAMTVLGVCAAAWLGLGLMLKLALPQWCGWVSAIALYALLLAEYAPASSVFEVQVFWIPAALLFVWLSWFLHVRNKSAGTAMFGAGLVLWFMPEVYSALYGLRPEWIQIEFTVKLVIAGVGMFRMRNKWMEWVA